MLPPRCGHLYPGVVHRVIERILNLLAFLLTAQRPVTAAEIRNTVAGYGAEHDEAFRRMFERDKALLRQLGVPLTLAPTDAWEVEFGYLIPPEEYEMPDPGLTDEERAALGLAAQVVRLGGQPQGPSALLKLGGAPLAVAGEPLAADLGADVGALGIAFAAIADRRLLRFRYRGRDRALQAYALVHRRGHWYVAGEDAAGGGGVRAFRLDRAADLRADDDAGAFRRPSGFDPATAIPEAPWEAGADDLTALVTFDSEVAWWARRQLTGDEEVMESDDGALEVRFRVANEDAFIGWLLGFADNAELVAPADLRERLVARVEGTA